VTVYFAQARIDPTTVKIGFTDDLAVRKKNLSVSTPGGIAILAELAGNKETEQYLHEKFAADRLSGEWFRCSDQIREFMRDVQNGKQGLIPFIDAALYMKRSTAEYAADAVEIARQMAVAIVNEEHRGVGDTLAAASFRIERRTGFPASMMKRIRVRQLTDVSAGTYLHLKDIYEQSRLKRAARESLGESAARD
jgi:hypothetical protein